MRGEEKKRIRYFYEGECPHCHKNQAVPNKDEGLERKVLCLWCKKPFEMRCAARMYGMGTVERLPTLEELTAVAEKFCNSAPVFARIALGCIENGAFKGAPANMAAIREQADEEAPF